LSALYFSTAPGNVLYIFQFDPFLQEWTQLSYGSDQNAPTVRINFGFTAASGHAFVFGGDISHGNLRIVKLQWQCSFDLVVME
jgi:hypothetical protein